MLNYVHLLISDLPKKHIFSELGAIFKMERLKSEEHVVGLKQSQKVVEAGKGKVAYISRDAEPHVKVPFENLCNSNGVPIVYVDTMKELAKACHIDVPTAVAVVL